MADAAGSIDVLEFLRARLLARTNQMLSRPAFERRRLARFRRFVTFVQANSAYYRRIMAERNITPASATPEQFPVLTKALLIEHFNDIVTAPGVTRQDVAAFLHTPSPPETLFRGQYVVIHTSGSSGEVAFFLYDRKDWARALAGLARAKSFGLTATRKRRIAFFGATQGHFAGATSASSTRMFPLNRVYELQTFEINRPLREVITGLNAFQPDLMVAYASGLRTLAEKKLAGELTISPRELTSSGEPLGAADRALIERAFGDRLRNFYACSEHMFMGLREASQESMCLFEDELMFEIHADHTLVTNIYNRTQPMIRYRMTDILSPLESREHAPYRAISDVGGRVEQLATFTNRHGKVDSLSPYTIIEVLIPHVRQFQMRLRGPESFAFAIVLQAGVSADQTQEAMAKARSSLTAILAEKEMDNVTFDVVPSAAIPVDPKTGKFKLILAAN